MLLMVLQGHMGIKESYVSKYHLHMYSTLYLVILYSTVQPWDGP